jgi:TatD DNase family protein
MIDTHCHIDMYANPEEIVEESEKLGIITIGMTNLPSHFEMGYNHLLTCKKVRLALGMHPLYAKSHEAESRKFKNNLDKTSFIGEIGLDFSREGISTKEIQISSFQGILSLIKDKRKILSLHSRRAEKEVLRYLLEYDVRTAIFHWYSGSISLIKEIIDSGYMFSINPEMIKSKHGQEVIKHIPKNYLLTETDGPFININGTPVRPKNVSLVQGHLSHIWNVSHETVEKQIYDNFDGILSHIR